MIAGPEPTPAIVRARAPLRIDLAGGDLLAAITPSVHVEVHLGGRTIRLRAEDRDERVTLSSPAAIAYDGRLDRLKAALNMLPVTGGIELLTRVDAPDDAGLGVTGALDVALLAALALCRQEFYGPAELAELALMLETDELKQLPHPEDVYLPVFGGVQLVEHRAGRVEGRAVRVSPERLADLAAYLIVASLGRAHVSGIMRDREPHAGEGGVAAPAAEAIALGDWPRLAKSFDASWHHQLSRDPLLSSPHTGAVADAARAAGAWGLKTTTAGSGGSLLVLCDPAARPGVEAALRDGGARILPCAFDRSGAEAVWVEGGERA